MKISEYVQQAQITGDRLTNVWSKQMKILEYVKQARSTAIYPTAFSYPALGLAGETGELIEKLASNDNIVGELGDVLWYLVNVAIDIEIDFCEMVCNITNESFIPRTFQEVTVSLKTSKDFRDSSIKLPIYVGKIAEVAKKSIRDGYADKLPFEKKVIVYESLRQIFICLFEICQKNNLHLEDVARTNIFKLKSRQERGVLQGSGDNR